MARQDKNWRCKKKSWCEESSRPRRGGGRFEVYHHAVNDAQAALLTDEGSAHLTHLSKETGAEVQLDQQSTPMPGMKTVIISGLRSQIEATVQLIGQVTGEQGTISDQAQAFWLQWVEAAFPDLDSRAYFLPPVYVNRVPVSRNSIANLKVLVLDSDSPQTSIIPFQKSDSKDDATMQRVIFCLQTLSEKNNEIFIGMSQLKYGHYLCEPCYAAAAAHLPLPKTLPNSQSRDRQGDFNVLLIHRYYGFIVCQVKAIDIKAIESKLKHSDADHTIQKKLRDAVQQLDKAQAMLSHLVSDIAPGLPVIKTIAFPNLRASQVQQAISEDLQQDLCQCLGASDPADIAGLCLCCDQLSDPKTPWDVSSHVLRELGDWWQRRVAGAGPDPRMTGDVYKKLVARFCGPATTVTVPSIFTPRICMKTLGQAVSFTGQCYAAEITLFPDQVQLLHTAPPRLFVTGPPGTGKTVVLQLMGIEWLSHQHQVFIVSTGTWSHAACTMLYHLLLQTVNMTDATHDRLNLLQYDFTLDTDVDKAVDDLSKLAREGSLHVIADEVGPEYGSHFQTFCEKLLEQVSCLHFWAGACHHKHAPADWQVEDLTRPLRSPPAVVREVEQDREITMDHAVKPYSKRDVPDHTDGPPVKRLYHRGQGHSSDELVDCITCGGEVASLLHSLRVGNQENAAIATATGTSTTDTTAPPCLHWKDVLVLTWGDITDSSNVVMGMKNAGIPVRVMTDDDIDDVATGRSDVVWVADGRRVRGLERKVVVCLERDVVPNPSGPISLRSVRLHFMSRCVSQLIIVSVDG